MDSGAGDNFIDSSLVKQAHIPVEALHSSRTVNALDGRRLAEITHRTLPITLIISGNHWEIIQLFVIPSPCSPVMPGLPWLRLHNPHIDWLPFPAGAPSATPTVSISSERRDSPAAPLPPDLSSVPQVYHDLAPVFYKERALSLPPHRPYDCGIDLLPGTPLPSSHLYNLSRPKREAMEEYINSSKASGFIRSSSSPLMGKTDGTLRPCIDYRGLNEITIKNKYPLPLICTILNTW